MNASWIDTLLAWIAAHPVLAGLVVFAIAFCDSLIILGTIVPALPLMIAVGVLLSAISLFGLLSLMFGPVPAFPRF